jgi:hypothetical protein
MFQDVGWPVFPGAPIGTSSERKRPERLVSQHRPNGCAALLGHIQIIPVQFRLESRVAATGLEPRGPARSFQIWPAGFMLYHAQLAVGFQCNTLDVFQSLWPVQPVLS